MLPLTVHRTVRIAAGIAALIVVAADVPPMPLLPGEWTFTNTPMAAVLDGRPLKDLPIGDAVKETACLTRVQALDPAGWIARDVAADCRLTRRVVSSGRIDVAGTCTPRDEGKPAGTVTLTGSYTATRYDVKFKTVAYGDNGKMGFSGTMTGRRIAEC